MTKTTTRMENKKLVGIMGFAAIAAVLTLSMVAVGFQSQLAEAAAANKGGVAYDDIEIRVTPAIAPTGTVSQSVPIVEYYFKSSNFNEWGANLILECATANHIQGKGKMSSFEGAQTGVKVFFTHWYDDGTESGTERVLYLNGTEADEVFVPTSDFTLSVDPKAKWNVCSQTFEIKTQLNALIEACTQEDIDNAVEGDPCFGAQPGDLRFVCANDPITGVPPDTKECQQYVELFLETAGTHPAKVFLNNVPHGDNGVKAYVEMDAMSQELVPDRTSVAIGKRMLDLYPVLSDNNNFLK